MACGDKNYADMLPLRVQSEETLRGYRLLAFVAMVVNRLMQDRLKKTPYNPISAFANMCNQKVKVYDKVTVLQKAFKKANDVYKPFGIKCPTSIDLG
jgi:hypothetical protein